MSVLLLAVGLLLLALPGALGPVGARLAPAEWCRAVIACLRSRASRSGPGWRSAPYPWRSSSPAPVRWPTPATRR
jgi:hypothetical protein